MDFTVGQYFREHARTVSSVLALTIGAFVASSNWIQQREWLNQVTLEVQASSAPAMQTSNPTQGALWLKMADGKTMLIRAKDWTSRIPKPFSRLRFDFPVASYQQAVLFPDLPIGNIEITGVRIIPHGRTAGTDVNLDRVQSSQHLETVNRGQASVTFRRLGQEGHPAMDIGIIDLLEQIPSPSAPRPIETALVFIAACLVTYWGVLLIAGNSRLPRLTPPFEPSPAPFLRFGIILGFVASMAVAAPQNSHPDEYLHVEAARYYGPHWLPPSLSDEWVIPSLSHYGVTYLATPDMGYFFAGKFAFLSRFLFPDVFTALRFFNVVLLASLFFWSARVFRESPATGIFFLTPQLWYAFSAYNTEGWAFFVSLLLVGQVAAKDSSLQQYLSPPPSGAIRRIVPALLLSCLLALTKMNFFVIVFSFFVVWLIWQLVTCWSESRLGHGMMRILPLILLPLMLRFGVQTYQNAVNHRDLPRTIQEQAEKYAQPDFKPSVIAAHGEGFEGLRMRERGVSLGDLLIRYRWLYMTAISFLGTYGWMALYSPAWFYLLMALGWVIFIGCVLLATFNTPSPSRRVFYAIVWLFLPLAVAASAYHSWTSDFQAQGRYLFPLLPILFYLVNAVGTASRRLLSATTWALFMVSAYGYTFFGLMAFAH